MSARSDVGRVRKVNEDSFLARMPVFLVADGMGGHARGDKASQAAVRIFEERITEGSAPTPDTVLEAIHAANDAVRSLSEYADTGIARAGTTLTGVVQVRAEGEDTDALTHWMVVNVGDSRVYGWDGRSLVQLSVDHSAVQELMDAGAITPEQAARHPERNVITRAIGAEDSVDADFSLLPVGGRQTFLVCSDGLTKELDDGKIAGLLAETAGQPDQDPATVLVNAALAAGGRDNVTVLVVESLPADRTGPLSSR
ncbi:MAG: protein phosphatase 2C domain-containing protein [Microbacteriaceae bacterium]